MSDRATQDAIQKIAGTFNKDHVTSVACTVTSVSIADRTCDCLPIGGTAITEIEGVQLMAQVDDGIFIVPAIDSTVIVMIPIKSDPYVIMYSQIDSISLVTDNDIQLQGDNYGGMVIAPVLLAALNALQTFAGQPLTTLLQLTNQKVKHGS